MIASLQSTTPESQSFNQNPNLHPVHMEEPLIDHHPPPQPITKNPTPIAWLPPAIIAFLLTASLTWLIYLLRPAIETSSSYTVSSATVHPFDISSSRLTSAWNISIYIKNYHQRRELDYDRVGLSIYYGSHLLSQVSIHPFYVQRSGHMTLNARLMNHTESLDVGAAESMVRDRLLRGAVDFRLELLARAKYYDFFWSAFNISCENMTVGFTDTDDVGPGVMLGPPRKCNLFADEKLK